MVVVMVFLNAIFSEFHSTEQTPFTRVFQSGTHFTAESTEAMRVKCLLLLLLPEKCSFKRLKIIALH